MPELQRCEKCGGPLPDTFGVTFDAERRVIARFGRSVRLSKYQALLVKTLMERPGRTTTRGLIEDALWGLESEPPSANHVSVLVHQTRIKLKRIGINNLSTIWGQGYVWGDKIEGVHPNGMQPSYKPATTFGDMSTRFRKAS